MSRRLACIVRRSLCIEQALPKALSLSATSLFRLAQVHRSSSPHRDSDRVVAMCEEEGDTAGAGSDDPADAVSTLSDFTAMWSPSLLESPVRILALQKSLDDLSARHTEGRGATTEWDEILQTAALSRLPQNNAPLFAVEMSRLAASALTEAPLLTWLKIVQIQLEQHRFSDATSVVMALRRLLAPLDCANPNADAFQRAVVTVWEWLLLRFGATPLPMDATCDLLWLVFDHFCSGTLRNCLMTPIEFHAARLRDHVGLQSPSTVDLVDWEEMFCKCWSALGRGGAAGLWRSTSSPTNISNILMELCECCLTRSKVPSLLACEILSGVKELPPNHIDASLLSRLITCAALSVRVSGDGCGSAALLKLAASVSVSTPTSFSDALRDITWSALLTEPSTPTQRLQRTIAHDGTSEWQALCAMRTAVDVVTVMDCDAAPNFSSHAAMNELTTHCMDSAASWLPVLFTYAQGVSRDGAPFVAPLWFPIGVPWMTWLCLLEVVVTQLVHLRWHAELRRQVIHVLISSLRETESTPIAVDNVIGAMMFLHEHGQHRDPHGMKLVETLTSRIADARGHVSPRQAALAYGLCELMGCPAALPHNLVDSDAMLEAL